MKKCKLWPTDQGLYWRGEAARASDAEILRKIKWADNGRKEMIRDKKSSQLRHNWTKVKCHFIREARRRGIYP